MKQLSSGSDLIFEKLGSIGNRCYDYANSFYDVIQALPGVSENFLIGTESLKNSIIGMSNHYINYFVKDGLHYIVDTTSRQYSRGAFVGDVFVSKSFEGVKSMISNYYSGGNWGLLETNNLYEYTLEKCLFNPKLIGIRLKNGDSGFTDYDGNLYGYDGKFIRNFGKMYIGEAD